MVVNDGHDRHEIPSMHERKPKRTITAYMCLLVGGGLGMHHIYLNRPVRAVLYSLTISFLGMGWLYDLMNLRCATALANWAYDKEYMESLIVKQRHQQKPNYDGVLGRELVLVFSWVAYFLFSSLPCKDLPDAVYAQFGAVGMALMAYYTACMDLPAVADASLAKMVIVSMLLRLVSDNNLICVIGCLFTFHMTRRWVFTAKHLDDPTVEDNVKQCAVTVFKALKKKSSRGFFYSLGRHIILLNLLTSLTCIGLWNHGYIDLLQQDGEMKRYIVRDTIHHIVQSPLFQEFKDRIYEIYNIMRESGYEEGWAQMKYQMDPSGLLRSHHVLGLDPNDDTLTFQDVKKAHRREVLKYHPDKYTGDDSEYAQKQFLQIQKAYEILKQYYTSNKDEL